MVYLQQVLIPMPKNLHNMDERFCTAELILRLH
jgi:hypothetical protein